MNREKQDGWMAGVEGDDGIYQDPVDEGREEGRWWLGEWYLPGMQLLMGDIGRGC